MLPFGREKKTTDRDSCSRAGNIVLERVCVDVVSREGDFGPLHPDGPVQLVL